MLFYMEHFSYMPHAVLHGTFLIHVPCCFMWGVSLTHSMLFLWGFSCICVLFYVGSLSYTSHAALCGISSCTPMLIYVGSFSYTLLWHACLCGEFLFHTPSLFMWVVSLTHYMLVYMGSFFYNTHTLLFYVVSIYYASCSLSVSKHGA